MPLYTKTLPLLLTLLFTTGIVTFAASSPADACDCVTGKISLKSKYKNAKGVYHIKVVKVGTSKEHGDRHASTIEVLDVFKGSKFTVGQTLLSFKNSSCSQYLKKGEHWIVFYSEHLEDDASETHLRVRQCAGNIKAEKLTPEFEAKLKRLKKLKPTTKTKRTTKKTKPTPPKPMLFLE